MMGFDSATSSFLDLLANKSYRKKTERQNLRNVTRFCSKKIENHFFVSEVLSSKPSARHKKFRWPVMVVKPEKDKIYSKNFKTISLSQGDIQYPCFKPEIVLLIHKNPYIIGT